MTVTRDGDLLPVLASEKPLIDQLPEERLKLLGSFIAHAGGKRGAPPTRSELEVFLHLCSRYDLDPFAKEAWLVVTESGGKRNVLTMAGRDGLRKIARRERLLIDSDVVRKDDKFRVERTPARERLVHHSYEGGTAERGEILGAWCEVYREDGRQMGFNFAPMTEYRPTSEAKLEYSPWGGAESIMILSAAERNALRQATPLGGLLAEGEAARVLSGNRIDESEALRDLVQSLDAPLETRERLWFEIEEANRASQNEWGLARAQMEFLGQSAEHLDRYAARMAEEREAREEVVRSAEMAQETLRGLLKESSPEGETDVPNEDQMEALKAIHASGGQEAVQETLRRLRELREEPVASDEEEAERAVEEREKLRHRIADLDILLEEDPGNEGLQRERDARDARLKELSE